MAAENARRTRPGRRRRGGFNEAAAHGRGKRPIRPAGSATQRACFNEAAAHGRGKRRPRPGPTSRRGGFNEAAAHGRGKLAALGGVR